MTTQDFIVIGVAVVAGSFVLWKMFRPLVKMGQGNSHCEDDCGCGKH